METVLTCPQLNALGFFYIGRKLIPTVRMNQKIIWESSAIRYYYMTFLLPQLIGTTLTYYIILRQFYLAEN